MEYDRGLWFWAWQARGPVVGRAGGSPSPGGGEGSGEAREGEKKGLMPPKQLLSPGVTKALCRKINVCVLWVGYICGG